MKSLVSPIIMGGLGIAILISLSVWQWQRLDWKEGLIRDAEAKLAAQPVDLPPLDRLNAEIDQYRPVELSGRLLPEPYFDVITSDPDFGAGYERILPFEMADERRVLVLVGQFPADKKRDNFAIPTQNIQFTGNVFFPQNTNDIEADAARRIWFGYDIADMAAAADAEPVLVFAREALVPEMMTSRLAPDFRNNHRNYALTWALLALAWAAMTVYWGWKRMTAKKEMG